MTNTINFTIFFIFSLAVYLGLTVGSGNILFWSKDEIILGIILSIISGLIISKIFSWLKINLSLKFLNPVRWFLFLIYIIFPLFFSIIKANLEVAYRIITNKIKPGIVKISPNLKTDFGITLLTNSITLTPGTLSVDIDKENNIYVHWLYVKNSNPKVSDIAGNFEKWIRTITE